MRFGPSADDTGMTKIMKTNLSFANPSEVETECLAVVVLDHGSKDKSEVRLETSDSAIKDVTSDLMSTGEVTGKIFETTLLHRPAKLKAKRLLLLAGGKAKNFTGSELAQTCRCGGTLPKTEGYSLFRFFNAR